MRVRKMSVVLGMMALATAGGWISAWGCGGSSGSGEEPHGDGGAVDTGTGVGDGATPDGDAAGSGDDAGDAGSPPDGAIHTASLPIKHIVFLVKENRTFDVYFGRFPGANGATTAKVSDGGTIPLGRLYDVSSPDISTPGRRR